MKKPSVAVILVNWNGYDYTVQCLLSLKRIDYPNFVVIVVDNASTDGSIDRLANQFDEVVFLQNEINQGFTGGNNSGIRHALDKGYDYICLLNNDTVVEPEFLNRLVNRMELDQSIGGIQPKILYNQTRDILWNAGGFFKSQWGMPVVRGENKVDEGQFDTSTSVDWITGCCMLLRTAVIREIGLLNDQYFAYFEDVDWSFRIKQLGVKLVYEPSAVIYHEAGVSSKTKKRTREGYVSPFAHYLNVRNHIFLLRSHARPAYLPTILLAQSVRLSGYIGYFLLRGRFKKLKAVVRACKDGIFSPLKAVEMT